ncbi:MAG: amidohydrolase family protein [Treponema sp.]|jgi:adenine deaminase|nr:amidohydrolase family protein [Treponema sp.]
MSLINTWVQKKLAAARPGLLAALEGRAPCDWRVCGGNVLDVFTLTVYPADVWLKDGFIVAVGDTQDTTFPSALYAINEYSAQGRLIIPGFVDSHMHVESVEVTPYNFGIAAAPTGTTTVFTDCHEAVNVGGYEAFKYMLEDSESSPVRQFLLIPSCVPAVNGLETAGAEWFAPDIQKIYDLHHPRVAGTAELMDYLGIIYGDKRMRDILEATRLNDGQPQGHALNVFGRALTSLRIQGVQGNHELYDAAGVLAAMKAGMHVDLSFVSSLLEGSGFLRDIMCNCIAKIGSLDKMSFCTDDLNLSVTLTEGRVNFAVSRFIAAAKETGLPWLGSDRFVYETIRAATLNAWREYGVENAGAIAPGYLADLQIVETDMSFRGWPSAVFVDGALIAQNGRLLQLPVKSPAALETECLNTVRLQPVSGGQLRIPVPAALVKNGKVKTRIMDFTQGLLNNTLYTAELPVENGYVSLADQNDLHFIMVFHRHGRNNNVGFGIAKGLTLKDGALAATVAHDGHNLTVIFRDNTLDQAVRAVNRLIDTRGGVVFCSACGKEFIKPLPVWGLMSVAGIEEAGKFVSEFETNFRLYNGPASNPMTAAILSLTCVPSYRVTDMGLIDTQEQKIIPVFVEQD